MKPNSFLYSLIFVSLVSCNKSVDVVPDTSNPKSSTTVTPVSGYEKYTIYAGQQYCDKSAYEPVQLQELKFSVKFDSSAIYKTINPGNQSDINKLYGFSDNNAPHHEFSARFGWRWSDNALRLFGYIYNNSVMSFRELGTVAIGAENECSIKATEGSYIFTLNGKTATMPRASTTATAVGYKLFPYFGGDELAPHTISISIKDKE